MVGGHKRSSNPSEGRKYWFASRSGRPCPPPRSSLTSALPHRAPSDTHPHLNSPSPASRAQPSQPPFPPADVLVLVHCARWSVSGSTPNGRQALPDLSTSFALSSNLRAFQPSSSSLATGGGSSTSSGTGGGTGAPPAAASFSSLALLRRFARFAFRSATSASVTFALSTPTSFFSRGFYPRADGEANASNREQATVREQEVTPLCVKFRDVVVGLFSERHGSPTVRFGGISERWGARETGRDAPDAANNTPPGEKGSVDPTHTSERETKRVRVPPLTPAKSAPP